MKNLVSVCRCTIYNNCSVEFDPSNLSVKDHQTRSVITRCNSSGNLYGCTPCCRLPLHTKLMHFSPTPFCFGIAASVTLGLRRSPNLYLVRSSSVIKTFPSLFVMHVNLDVTLVYLFLHLVHVLSKFLIWFIVTFGPLLSLLFYYLIILYDCSLYSLMFPLWFKSDTSTTLFKGWNLSKGWIAGI